MSTRLKPINENSWLVMSDNNERVGLLTLSREKYTLSVGSNKQCFSSITEVNEHFKEDVFAPLVEVKKEPEPKKRVYIRGFPAEGKAAYEIFTTESDLPLFTKKINGQTVYGAGYYCIYCTKGWTPTFSPKYTTLTAYPLVGPFKDEKEMRIELAKLRREENERNKKVRIQGKEC